MESRASRLLQKLNETRRALVTAESCTGGLIASRLTRVAGASSAYWGGMIVYDNTAKAGLAGVAPELIARHGAVSPEVARALAEGALERARSATSDGAFSGREWLAIATTGIAGPTGGSAEKPVGLCHIGLAWSRGTEVTVTSFELRLPPALSREQLQEGFAETAFDKALAALSGLPALSI